MKRATSDRSGTSWPLRGPAARWPTLWSALLAIVAAAGCAAPALGPGWATAERRDSLEDVFLLSGELRAVRSAEIVTPRMESGQPQIQWLAEDGREVAVGDRLAQLDDSALLAQLEERRTRLAQASIQRESREQELAAERDRKRVAGDKAELEVELARVDAAVPRELKSAVDWRTAQAMLLEKQAAAEKARLDLEALEAQARADLASLGAAEDKARRELQAATQSLQSATLRAPRPGIFVVGRHWRDEERKLQAGDMIWPGFAVASIPDPSQMEVDGQLPETDHGRVAVGMSVRVVLDTWPDRVFAGSVTSVGAVASSARDRPGFPVRIALAETDPERMRPGLSVRVEVVRGRWTRPLVVPRSAVRFEAEGAVVEPAGSGRPAAVALATCTPLECVVESGLAEGQRVRVF